MDKMIVGIDYAQDGARIIAHIEFSRARNDLLIAEIALYYKDYYDEVYIVDFNPNCEDFINEIVLKGCRV